jgi:putative ABC transport system ATP-binding protein
MAARDLLIKVTDLHRHFKIGDETVRALNGVSLEIARGEFFGIAGSSGSGKSTLLYILGGMDRPTSGQVEVNGWKIGALDENELASYRAVTVGFIFQSFHLVPSMTALENVELPMLLAGTSLAKRRQRARELLAQVGLAQRMKHRPSELSGGQRQRVAIARALANQPPLLLSDEPTGNLDSRTGAEVIQLLQRLCCEQNVTVLLVSHDPGIIAQTERSILLQDGVMCAMTSPAGCDQRRLPCG